MAVSLLSRKRDLAYLIHFAINTPMVLSTSFSPSVVQSKYFVPLSSEKIKDSPFKPPRPNSLQTEHLTNSLSDRPPIPLPAFHRPQFRTESEELVH